MIEYLEFKSAFPEGSKEETLEWIAFQLQTVEDIICGIEVDLKLSGILKGEQHSRDELITNEFNDGIKPILLALARRKARYSTYAAEYGALEVDILKRRTDFFEDWSVSVDKSKELLNVSKMTLRQIADYVLRKELDFWSGQDNQWTDDNDRNVVEALTQRLWKDKHKISGVTDEEIPEEPGHFYADLDIREIVSDLQILGMFGLLNEKNKDRIDGGVAEGKIDELLGVLSKLQVSKERLNETTFAHPRYGLILYEVMRRMKDQPSLRKGVVPILKEGFVPPGFGRSAVHDRVVQRHGEKLLLLGDRYTETYDIQGNLTGYRVDEYTPTKPGDITLFDYNPATMGIIAEAKNDRVVKRNGMDILLVGDRLNKIVDEEGRELGARWYDSDAEQAGDEKLYEYDPKFCYETLASDVGKDVLKQYAAHLLALIDEQRLEEIEAAKVGRTLNQKKIHFKELVGQNFPDPADDKLGASDISRLQMYARFLFFSFPFLTNILAMRQERTMTPAHGFNNKGLPFVFLFDIPGFIVHKSQRYANSDTAYFYMLKFFSEFREGEFGAGGEARRLNMARELVIKYDQVFDDDGDNVAVVPKMGYGSSLFHTALSMVANEVEATSTLTGKAELYDGTHIDASPTHPVYLGLGGKQATRKFEPFNYGLLYTSLGAWDEFFTQILQNLPANLSIEHIAEGGGKEKSLIGKLYGDGIGKIKMSSTHTREKAQSPHLREFSHLKITANVLWDFIKRIFSEYQATSIEARINLYEEIEKGLKHTAEVGGLSAGDSGEVLKEVLRLMSKPDANGKLYGKGTNGFKGMNPCLKYQETSITGTRGIQVFEYVKALWEYKHLNAEGHVAKPFPFELIDGGHEIGKLAFNRKIIRQMFDPDPEIALYEAMLYGKRLVKGKLEVGNVPPPFERVHLEKHDD